MSFGNGVGMTRSHGVSEDACRVDGPLVLHGPPLSYIGKRAWWDAKCGRESKRALHYKDREREEWRGGRARKGWNLGVGIADPGAYVA